MVFWAKSLIIMYGIRFGGGRVEILTSPIITPPYSNEFSPNRKWNGGDGISAVRNIFFST